MMGTVFFLMRTRLAAGGALVRLAGANCAVAKTLSSFAASRPWGYSRTMGEARRMRVLEEPTETPA
jgi:hypothetical protein